MIKVETAEGTEYLNENRIILLRPRKGAGAVILHEDYQVRGESKWVWGDLSVKDDPADLADRAGLVKGTQDNGSYLYFNPNALISAITTRDRTKLQFPADLADSSSPVSSGTVTIQEDISELEGIKL